jgi:hypothetical protein
MLPDGGNRLQLRFARIKGFGGRSFRELSYKFSQKGVKYCTLHFRLVLVRYFDEISYLLFMIDSAKGVGSFKETEILA